MPRRKEIFRTPLALVMAIAAVACDAQPKSEAPVEAPAKPPAEEAPAQVIAQTAGAIRRASSIHVEFDKPVNRGNEGSDPTELIRFEPNLPGQAEWISATRLVFKPSAPLQPKVKYVATVQIEGREVSTFKVWVVPQSFEARWYGVESRQGDRRRFRGAIETRDTALGAQVEKMLVATVDGEALSPTWQHSEDGQRHTFEIEIVQTQEQARTLKLTVDGAPLGLTDKASHSAIIPGVGVFTAMSARGRGRTGPIEIRFSDPIADNQNLAGLITTQSRRSLRVDVQGSVVRIYSSKAWSDAEVVIVSKSVRNQRGRRLKREHRFRITQAAQKPSVKFLGKGVVLPLKPGVALPIETASLRAIRVRAVRVPPSNLGQFFQVNSMDGTTEMRRVGRVVWRQRVELGADLGGGGTRLGLDLSKLIESQGQGLYHLELSFRPEDSTYDCPAGSFPEHGFEPLDEAEDDGATNYSPEEASSWDNAWGAWISGLDAGEQYRQRNNPCHLAYFLPQEDHDIRASRNVLLTNIAVVAKKDPQNRLSVFAADLLSAQPLRGAEVEAYEFSHDLLAKGQTDANGRVTLAPKGHAYTVLVRHAGQIGALRMHDSESLTVSHFDVGGAEVTKGLKGFLYGERGVWRPGDDIYLHFILKDEDGRIPKDHPILFTLKGPRGAIVDSQKITSSVGRFYAITTRTGSEAPTGTYQAEVRVGGATFAADLAVEAVVPNRLKIDLDFGTELLEGPTVKLNTTLKSRWLHGAIARSLRAEVDVALSAVRTRFPKYDDYVFDDPTRRLTSPPSRVFMGTLDDKGEVQVTATVKVEGAAPGMAQAAFTTRVFEESGQSSSDRHTVRFSPYSRYIGVKIPKGDRARGMLLTDVDHPVDIAAVDAHGKPVDATVKVKIYQINWRWWWEKGSEDLSQYAGRVSHTPLAEGEVAVKEGRGKWSFNIKYPSWGRYLITVSDQNGGHRTGRVFYADWPGWAGRGQKDNPGGPAVLTVVADEPRVKVGDSIGVTFPTPTKGRALVTIETGSRVVSSEWIDVQGETTRYEMAASPEMTPNIYVHVMLVQPYSDKGNDHPIRLYGVTPVSVRDPGTVLKPVIDAAQEMEPASEHTVAVREANGKPMTYTLAIVDEGLLGLTRHKTPNPWSHFHRREGLGIKTWDNYNHVVGGYAGTLETLLAIGGGDEGEEDDAAKAQRFPPVVIVKGPYSLEAGQINRHKFEMPTYLGEVRVMVVAGNEKAYGAAERSVFVRKPLMAYATVPRVLSPKDALQLPVTVFSTIEGAHKVGLSLDIEGDVRATKNQRTLTFDGAGEQAVTFPLQVGNTPGIARLRFSVSSGEHRHTESIEVEVRYPNPPEVTVVDHALAPGESWSPELARVGLRAVTAEVEVGRGLAIGLGRRLDYLIGYPHGCLEQTVSRAFPQVFLGQIQPLDAAAGEMIQKHVNAAIEKLRLYQTASGGFGVWPSAASHDWTSSWAGHFLVEARRAGFVIDDGMIERWRGYQEQQARSWSEGSLGRGQLIQAYRLYTLALAGKPDLSSMNRLREQSGLDPQASLRLALAYGVVGAPEVAAKLVPPSITYEDSDGLDASFGSALRDRAMALEALVLLRQAPQAKLLATTVAQALDSARAMSTQETAFALLAMSRYLAMVTTGPEPSVRLRFGGQEEAVVMSKTLFRKRLETADGVPAGFAVQNDGEVPVYVRLTRRGQPDIGESEAKSDGLEVEVEYDVQADEFVQGEDIRATVKVRNISGRPLSDVALTHIVPAGWEIRNDRFEGRRDLGGNYEYRDIRDDRIHTYFGLDKGASKTFSVRLHSTFVGRFYLPPLFAEAMYDPSLQAQSAGRWIEVVAPGADR